MKLNKILMVLAATAIVGCTTDDVSDFTANQANEDSRLVQLDPNFVLAGVGVEDATTRTHWEQIPGGGLRNKFLPIYNAGAAAGQSLDVAAELGEQAVGLCWLGNGAVGTDVYTNYEFYHFGWLNNGAAKAVFECDELTNGSLYTEITPLAAVTNGAGGEADEVLDFAGAIPVKSQTGLGADNLNYNSGVYMTDNKAIFGGQYIVYYPYNPEFKNAGTIPAIAKTTWNNVSEAFDTPEIGKYTFRYSSPVTIEGGAKASDFGLYNLSTLVQLRVASPAWTAIGKNIDQIVLYSPSKKLLKQANLAADQIAAGNTGTDLYASTEGIKTITANFTAPVAVVMTNGAVTSAYITVLPTTVDDLVVLVHATDGTWATVNMPNTVFEAGKAKRMDIIVNAADFNTDYIAVDESSLVTARNEARLAITADPTFRPTITVIGDITLDGANADVALVPAVPGPFAPAIYNFNTANDRFITVKGDAIIIPEDMLLNTRVNMKSNLRILGKSCCDGTQGGRLVTFGGTLNNVTMEPTEANVTPATYDLLNPMVTYTTRATTVAAGKTFDVQAGNVIVNHAVQHKGDINIAAGAKLTVNGPTGDLNFMGSTVVNDGTIEVLQSGKYDMTDKNGNATATDGQRMTNNGKFIHNVDAGVGTAVQKMNQNGEYRCRVNEQIKLDDAFLQWTACSVIEMVNTTPNEQYNLGSASGITPTAYQHNGKYIDIEVNCGVGGSAIFTNPVISSGNGDSKDIQIGNLTVVAGGLTIDYITGAGPNIGKRKLTVNGDMTVKANTDIFESKQIIVKQNLTVEGATLWYEGYKQNEDGLAVTGNITVSGGLGYFNAGDLNAIKITCANFYLKSGGRADFGNRTEGDSKNLIVSGTIDNPAGCKFYITAANQVPGSVLAWVTCSELKVGGDFTAARPRVE